MNKTVVGVIAIVVVAGGAFWGGMQYAKGQVPARQLGGGFGQYAAAGMRGGRAGAGGLIAGQIVSSDPGSITVQSGSTSSMIVLIGSSTEVFKTALGSQNDLAAGTSVVVMGTPNSDGSMTAQSIQIRPAGLNFPGRGATAGAQSAASAQ